MRFEVFLTQLPTLAPTEVKAKMGDLPSGFSVGVMTKALVDKKLPSNAVAWADDAKAIAKVTERIRALGGGCRVEDHASFVQKVWSAIEDHFDSGLSNVGDQVAKQVAAKKAAAAQTKAPAIAPKKDTPYGRIAAAMFGSLLSLLLKLAVGNALLIAIELTGAAPEQATPEKLVPTVLAFSLGVLCVHVMAIGVTAVFAQQVTLLIAAPVVVVPLVVVSIATVNVVMPPVIVQPQGVVQTAAAPPPRAFEEEDNTPWPPPRSRPYQGLIEELRIRKLRDSEHALQEIEADGDAVAGELPAGVGKPSQKEAAKATDAAKAAAGESKQAVVETKVVTTTVEPGSTATAEPIAPPVTTEATASTQAPVASAAPKAATSKRTTATKTAKTKKVVPHKPRPLWPPPWPDLVSAAIAAAIWLLTVLLFLGLRFRERKRVKKQLEQVTAKVTVELAQVRTELQTELDATRAALRQAQAELAASSSKLNERNVELDILGVQLEQRVRERADVGVTLQDAIDERDALASELEALRELARTPVARPPANARPAPARDPRRDADLAQASTVADEQIRVPVGFDATEHPADGPTTSSRRRPLAARSPGAAERAGEPRSSYAVRDVREERIGAARKPAG